MKINKRQYNMEVKLATNPVLYCLIKECNKVCVLLFSSSILYKLFTNVEVEKIEKLLYKNQTQ